MENKTCSFILRYFGSKPFSRISWYSPDIRQNVVGKKLLISRCLAKIKNRSSLKFKIGYSFLESSWWLRYPEEQITHNSTFYQNTN